MFAPADRCPECLDGDYRLSARAAAPMDSAVPVSPGTAYEVDCATKYPFSVPMASGGLYTLSQTAKLTASEMADLAKQLATVSSAVDDMKIKVMPPQPAVRPSSIRMTGDDECLWLECFADGSARTICPVENGMTWDDLAERVESHIADHGC